MRWSAFPFEGKFGQGKNGYGLGRIRAKRADTSEAWILGIFLVMNLIVLLRFLFVSKMPGIKRVVVALQAHFGAYVRLLSIPGWRSSQAHGGVQAGALTS